MHEKEVWLCVKDQETEGDPSAEHPEQPRKHHKTNRGSIRLADRYLTSKVGKLALVFELMEMNLYECLRNKKKPLTMHKIKYYMFQVLKAIEYMHRKHIFHRDIKP
jgi:serine/threonine protein kinase